MKTFPSLRISPIGQILLLATNAILLIIILTNFSIANTSNFIPEKELLEDENLATTLMENTPESSLTTSTRFEPFIGEISIFSGNFAPRGFAFCDGQLLSINQNQALFSILGTTYGGNGRTTFGLPDLRGRIPVHPNTAEGQRLGSKTNAQMVMPYFDDKYNPVLPPSTQSVNYIIAVVGIFPSRN